MPTYTAPGVYVEEAPSSAPPIHTLPTSIAAFIGRTPRGPTNEPILITSVLDYARIFGGLRQDSTVAYAVRHYFENGGRQAIVVRVDNDAVESTSGTLASAGAGSGLELQAENSGEWGNRLRVDIDHDTSDGLFNLTVRELDDALADVVAEISHRDLSPERDHPRFVGNILGQESSLVRVANPSEEFQSRPAVVNNAAFAGGSDGSEVGFDQIGDPALRASQHGLWALDLPRHLQPALYPAIHAHAGGRRQYLGRGEAILP
jgi:hypothetical protein